MSNRGELRLFRSRHRRLFRDRRGGFCIKSVKNGGTNEDREEKGYYIHTDTEQEGLPAANCVEGCAFHWI